jgi:hypothetical protein
MNVDPTHKRGDQECCRRAAPLSLPNPKRPANCNTVRPGNTVCHGGAARRYCYLVSSHPPSILASCYEVSLREWASPFGSFGTRAEESLDIPLSALRFAATACCYPSYRLTILLSIQEYCYKLSVRERAPRRAQRCMFSYRTVFPCFSIRPTMDAVDEPYCTAGLARVPSPQEEVLEFVDEIVSLHPPNVHIRVTSRPEHDIQPVPKHLAPCMMPRLTVSLTNPPCALLEEAFSPGIDGMCAPFMPSL